MRTTKSYLGRQLAKNRDFKIQATEISSGKDLLGFGASVFASTPADFRVGGNPRARATKATSGIARNAEREGTNRYRLIAA